jgi:cytochrome b subunit of formate dehydrogenase
MSRVGDAQAESRAPADRIVRHAGLDRAIHWIAAVSVLALLFTAFLPILGIEFAWVTIHWVAGFVLIAIVAVHVVRAVMWQDLRSMWIDSRDLSDAAAIVRRTWRLPGEPPGKPGKYSFAQKLIHLAFTVVVLAAAVTGALMMVKIDTPWWERNPYWLSDGQWGVVYVVHGLAALCLVTMVMAHVYFALRPEKLHFTRSMILGWITRAEYRDEHDPNRWQVDR